MGRALVEVLLLGTVGAVVGVHAGLRRLAFVTEAVQHTVFPGMAVAGPGAAAPGLRVRLLAAVLSAVTAARVVVPARAIGTVLVVAFVVTPAATGRLLTRSIPGAMTVAAGVGTVLGWIGLSASYE